MSKTNFTDKKSSKSLVSLAIKRPQGIKGGKKVVKKGEPKNPTTKFVDWKKRNGKPKYLLLVNVEGKK